jgi:hypothetical protein
MLLEEGLLKLNLTLTVDRFGQVMQGRLFVVRPGLLTSGSAYSFSSKQRSTPIRLEADLRSNAILIKLPDGPKVDEIPEPIKIDGPYGKLECSRSLKDGAILMQEMLEIREVLAPVSEYAKVREFFDLVAGAHSAPVILRKQQ